jgi:hypothetical protein
MKQILIIIALALLTTIANAQNISSSHQVRANDEVKKQQVENRSEPSPDLQDIFSSPSFSLSHQSFITKNGNVLMS